LGGGGGHLGDHVAFRKGRPSAGNDGLLRGLFVVGEASGMERLRILPRPRRYKSGGPRERELQPTRSAR
jgi:hypothetical protein